MCGIFGVFGNPNAARLSSLGLFAIQHRGQESCGMAVSDGKVIRLRKKMGLIKEVFTESELDKLPGSIAIGHVRYPTKGSATEFNTQPHLVETLAGPTYALASNGDIVNYHAMRRFLEEHNVYFKSDNDGELLVKYIAYQVMRQGDGIIEAIRHMMRDIKGAYSTVLCTRDALYMFRDPHSIRPMVWGKMQDGTVVVASESCALDTLGATDRQEIPPAGIIKVSEEGIRVLENDPALYRSVPNPQHCIFEQIYFSRPDSYHFGEEVFRVREALGAALAKADAGLKADYVVPVPDSANFIGLGYSNEAKIPLSLGLIRNHYIGRTFIKPEQTIRDESVRQKFNLLPNFFKDKSVVLIDDSIVRGTTIRKIVELIKRAGVREVHLRIGSPQVKYSCYYGIDTPSKEELIANRFELEQIRQRTGVDSLKFLDINDLRSCVQKPEDYCYACFNGDYPLGVAGD
ncbi:MAG: amidophosphoribosyltransferase [Candidatus Cloacimonetes bacterium]|nr:amidophosphoribosyltransferase [Candidatus Cloacimonadota bacterium]MCB5287643.1 amidophosphoribosyltransferase [Candidatus Cloacimonadota bacterium]MCK9184622.1 amidophosphoribosyltransferase [Candidatus Cloacimonadota bacterium]MDY0229964.1 amidophosphoribosyltransferase [Candidatus Cloacimonadaceae bacterium]